MLNILFCVVKQQNVLHWAIFSSGRIVCKLVWYRCCVASTLPCLALMTPKIKWFLLAQIKSSAVLDYAVHTVHCFCFLAKVLLVLCSYYETLSTGEKKSVKTVLPLFWLSVPDLIHNEAMKMRRNSPLCFSVLFKTWMCKKETYGKSLLRLDLSLCIEVARYKNRNVKFQLVTWSLSVISFDCNKRWCSAQYICVTCKGSDAYSWDDCVKTAMELTEEAVNKHFRTGTIQYTKYVTATQLSDYIV